MNTMGIPRGKRQSMTASEFLALERSLWSEAEFQRRLTALARSLGWRVATFRKVRVQRKGGPTYWETPVGADGAGWPDLVMVRRDRIVAAELKVKRNRPTAEQRWWLADLAAAGLEAHVWTPGEWDAITEVLR